MALTNVHLITVRHGRISVDVDRYTFTFVPDIGPGGRIELGEIAAFVHGKRDSRVERTDVVAKHARQESRGLIALVLRHWLREHPGLTLDALPDGVLWSHPDHADISDDQRAANRAAIDQLVSTLSDQLKMPGGCKRRRPFS